MKKTIIIILGICIGSRIIAQSPCDVRLADQVQAKLGSNELFLKDFAVSSAHDDKAHAKFSLWLNNQKCFGFIIGNSIISKEDITFTLSNSKGTIEEIKVAPGQFERIDFNCKTQDIYHLTFTSDNPGEVCANAIMSFVKSDTPDQ